MGVVGTSAHFTGRRTAGLIQAWLRGDQGEALQIFRSLLPAYTGVATPRRHDGQGRAGTPRFPRRERPACAAAVEASDQQAKAFGAILDATDL